ARMTAMLQPEPSTPKTPWTRSRTLVLRALAFLAGTHAAAVEVQPWSVFVRALLGLTLLIVLSLIGLQTLYVTNGATFGSGGLYDYLGLFLWGLSADIGQRTLQNLPGRA